MATMVKLQTVTIGSGGASTIDFTSIPQTYTDLKIVVSGRASTTVQYFTVQFNGNTTGYSCRFLNGDGATATSGTDSFIFGRLNNSSYTASVFANTEIYIPNYTSANNKSVTMDGVSENNATTALSGFSAGLWSNTSAITSIQLAPASGNFAQYSTATLYGIKNVTTATGTGKATGGDQIYTDGTYWYHKFTTVGTSSFTPLTSLTADYLVVAGGGGGAAAIPSNNAGGGGGAGGVRCTVGATGGGGSLESALSLSATAYTVTVGDGGAGGAQGGNNNGTVGSDSVFGSITATGGGYGGAEAFSGGAGGSGGGSGRKTASQTGGAGTANQGYNGGDSVNSGNYPGGGGGGANAVGANATTSNGGAGGAGITTTISGISSSYGGGGGGGVYITGTPGAGGLGGGGAAGAAGLNAGNPGTANTGGGGGGASINSTAGGRGGGKGGSGIVIVRYAV